MDIQNRDNFLNKLAQKMGRSAPKTVADPMPALVNDYPTTRLTDRSQAELCQEFIDFAKVMAVDVFESKESDIAKTVIEACEKYGSGNIVINDDQRLADLGISQALAEKFNCHFWNETQGEQNIAKSAKANIGVVYGEYGLTESGGIVLFSSRNYGRSVSLLPETSIVVLRKSTILPRVAQLAKILHDKAQNGERMPSCINIISGPSATADIELIKVVGVHGPVHKIYVLIDDL